MNILLKVYSIIDLIGALLLFGIQYLSLQTNISYIISLYLISKIRYAKYGDITCFFDMMAGLFLAISNMGLFDRFNFLFGFWLLQKAVVGLFIRDLIRLEGEKGNNLIDH